MEPIFPIRSSLLSAEAISTEVLPQPYLSNHNPIRDNLLPEKLSQELANIGRRKM